MKHRSNYRVARTHSQTAPPCQPHQQQRLLQPPVGQAGSTNHPQSTRKCLREPLRRLNEPPQPLSLQLLSLNVNGLRERQKPAADRNSISRPLFGLKPGSFGHLHHLTECGQLPCNPPKKTSDAQPSLLHRAMLLGSAIHSALRRSSAAAFTCSNFLNLGTNLPYTEPITSSVTCCLLCGMLIE